jgi:catalase
VLYHAVVLATGADGAQQLRNLPAARYFVSDAFAHCKFIGYSESAAELFDAVGLAQDRRGPPLMTGEDDQTV